MIVAYYLVGGEHFAIRKEPGGEHSLWHHGALIKAGIRTKADAITRMSRLIAANLDDRAHRARLAVSDFQEARARLHTGGLEAFQVLERSKP